jgi:hypothetical protein
MTSHQQALFATDLAPTCETSEITVIKEVMDPYFYQLHTARSLFYLKDERYDKPFFLRSRDFLGKGYPMEIESTLAEAFQYSPHLFSPERKVARLQRGSEFHENESRREECIKLAEDLLNTAIAP